jgi:hypothetical protein
VATIIQEQHRGNHDRNQRWARHERAALFERYDELHTQGVSQRQAAKTLNVPRFLTRADGTTAAERFFGQKLRSMFAAIPASVEIPPAPLSPPQRGIE